MWSYGGGDTLSVRPGARCQAIEALPSPRNGLMLSDEVV